VPWLAHAFEVRPSPDDEHTGRGPAIRHARRVGLARARRQRIAYHRDLKQATS
jgi:hypothetical protein